MIIEDEPDIRVYLSTALEDNGHNVVTADEGESVIRIVDEKKPDLIILDIMMPKRSGISIYRELRKSQKANDIPIILMSGMVPAKDFMTSGFRNLIHDETIPLPDGFIEKPIRLDELFRVIENLLP
jgi:twitching motility two-component system response regulator PilH